VKTLNSAVVGFLDISISCLVIAALPAMSSLLWGLVGAAGFALLYLAFSLAMAAAGLREESDGPDIADRMDEISAGLDSLPDDDPDPWPVRWFYNVVAALLWLVFSIGVIIVGFSRTVVTMIVFAALTPDVRPWTVLVAFAASAALQYVISSLVFEPQAKRLGFEM
jgi:hypothetical protein